MYLSKKLVSLVAVFSIVSCGGGDNDPTTPETVTPEVGTETDVTTESGSVTAVETTIPPQCAQHADFFEQLSGERVGTITTFEGPGERSCEFNVSLVINKDPSMANCQVTASAAYTSVKLGDSPIRVCDSTEGRDFNVIFLQPIQLVDQVPLPIGLLIQPPSGPLPIQQNGAIVDYPLGAPIELDANYNIIVNGQFFLTRP